VYYYSYQKNEGGSQGTFEQNNALMDVRGLWIEKYFHIVFIFAYENVR
jgi:hypothetical protein